MNDAIELFSSNSMYVMLTIGTIFNIFWVNKFKSRLNISRMSVIVLSILHTICGVVCVRIFAIMEAGFDLSKAGNFSLFGGVFFMPLIYFTLSRVFKWSCSEVFDIFTICIMFTFMCARISCIVSGCCAGRLIPGMSMHYPTREAEIIFYLVMIIWLGKKVLEGKLQGRIYPIYMIAYGVFRFINECFRARINSTIIHPAHFWALICLIAGLSMYLELKVTEDKRKNNQGRRRR